MIRHAQLSDAPPSAPVLRRKAGWVGPSPERHARRPCPPARPAKRAAGELSAARELTAKLQGGAGAPRAALAAPAHLLIFLYDRCCDWASALGVITGLEATGVPADAQTLGSLIAALWGCGSVAGCMLALRVFEDACRLGLFKCAALSPSHAPAAP